MFIHVHFKEALMLFLIVGRFNRVPQRDEVSVRLSFLHLLSETCFYSLDAVQIEVSLALSHSADPPPANLVHAPLFLLDWAPLACVHAFAASLCAQHVVVSSLTVLHEQLTYIPKHFVLGIYWQYWGCCCVEACGHIILQDLHHCDNQCEPLNCGTPLCVVLFHGSLRWFVLYLLPTHCAWDHRVCCNLLPEIFAGYKCVFITVVYQNARAPGVSIRVQLCSRVCAVRLLIWTTPNSVYSYSKSVKSPV